MDRVQHLVPSFDGGDDFGGVLGPGKGFWVSMVYGHMSNPDPMLDPENPEWPVAWAAKEILRRHLSPKFDRRLPLFLAKAILERIRLPKWRVSKEPESAAFDTGRVVARPVMGSCYTEKNRLGLHKIRRVKSTLQM